MKLFFAPTGILSSGLLAGAAFAFWLRSMQWLFHIDIDHGNASDLSMGMTVAIAIVGCVFRAFIEPEKKS